MVISGKLLFKGKKCSANGCDPLNNKQFDRAMWLFFWLSCFCFVSLTIDDGGSHAIVFLFATQRILNFIMQVLACRRSPHLIVFTYELQRKLLISLEE